MNMDMYYYVLLGPYAATLARTENGLGRIFLSLLQGSGIPLRPGESSNASRGCFALIVPSLSGTHACTMLNEQVKGPYDLHICYLPLG